MSDFCDLELGNEITQPDGLIPAGADDVVDVQLAVQQRRSGSGGKPDSVVDFDVHSHMAQTSSSFFGDQVGRLISVSYTQFYACRVGLVRLVTTIE